MIVNKPQVETFDKCSIYFTFDIVEGDQRLCYSTIIACYVLLYGIG